MNSRLKLGTRLVADVGGTNTRLSLYDAERDQFRALATYINRDFATFQAVIADWLGKLGEAPPQTACIAIAAPPSEDRVSMSNMDWSFSCRELARQFEFQRVRWINDFEGNAYALPHLGAADREEIRAGEAIEGANLAVLGPGTGLGGAFVRIAGDGYRACACEPGHMGLSPGTEEELELFRLLLPRHGDIFTELLVSGPGLQRLYEGLAQVRGEAVSARTPAEISTRAVAGNDALCSAALASFCGLLGSACGDFILATGSYGGLYLAGGIVPRMVPFLRDSSFLSRLAAKGAMRDHLSRVPVFAITTAHPGLIGAAHAPVD